MSVVTNKKCSTLQSQLRCSSNDANVNRNITFVSIHCQNSEKQQRIVAQKEPH